MLKVDFVALTTALHHLQLLAKALRDVVLHLLAERRVHKLKRESARTPHHATPPRTWWSAQRQQSGDQSMRRIDLFALEAEDK